MKRVPPLLVAAFVMAVGFALVQLAHAAYASNALDYFVGAGWLVAENGVYIAVAVLGALGLAELARRSSGAALGAWIAAVAMLVQGVVELGWIGVGYHGLVHPDASLRSATHALALVGWAVMLATAVGIGLATRRWAIGAVCVVIAAFVNPPWFVAHALWGGLDLGFRAQAALQFAPRALLGAVLLAAAVVASRAAAVAELPVESASAGLRSVAGALWLKIAPVALVAVNIALLDHSPAVALIATVLDAAALVWLAVGAQRVLRGAIADVPRWPLVFAISAALWLVGVTIAQLPWRYDALNGPRDALGVPSPFGAYATAALHITREIVVAGAIVCVLTAIMQLAARRGLEALGQRARITSIGYVVLTACSVATERWLGPDPASLGIAVAVVAAGAGAFALGLAAHLCTAAAPDLDSEGGLPAAKVV